MADVTITQKTTATLTYILDCANRLSKAYPAAPVTISSAAIATQPSPGVASACSGSGTTATFKLATNAMTPAASPLPVLYINLTLSNGDVDPIEIAVGAVA